jgi:hypothetical protein
MRFLLSLLCAAFLSTSLAPVAHANLHGKYLQGCPVANNAQIDPLASPGVAVSDHAHSEAGSRVFTPTSTTADFLNATTSCFLHSNHSAYWVPQMRKSDGTLVPATNFATYYQAAGADPALIAGGKIEPYPVGMRFLIGDHNSTVLQSTSIIRWHCNVANPTQLHSPPTSCPAGVGIEADFNGPNCWDGMRLDSPDHMDHLAYGGSSCPADHPIRLPQLLAEWFWPAAAVGACPDSDHGIAPCGRSMHMDSWEAQDPAVQDQLTRCVNDPARNTATSPLCGVFTYDGSPNPPNAWWPGLLAASSVVGYVNATGGPA